MDHLDTLIGVSRVEGFAPSGGDGHLGVKQAPWRQVNALDRLNPVFQFLEECYAERIRVEDAAAKVRMSTSYFMHFFKEVTGQSFITYLNRLRIEKGKELLACTDKSIAEISQDVGFCDQSYFGLTFKKIYLMTPRQYRMSVLLRPGSSSN